MVNGMSGKGDTQRPSFIPEEERALRWDYAFRKDLPNMSFEDWLKTKKGDKNEQ
jgi:hypothetical protein